MENFTNADYSRHLLPWFGLESTENNGINLPYIRRALRIEAQTACNLCDISPATLKRWEKGRCPRWVIPYLMACTGFLLAKGWEGWRVTDDRLHQPQARAHSLLYRGFTQGDFRALEFTRLNYTTTQLKIDDLATENAALRKVHHRPHKKEPAKQTNIINFLEHKKTRA